MSAPSRIAMSVDGPDFNLTQDGDGTLTLTHGGIDFIVHDVSFDQAARMYRLVEQPRLRLVASGVGLGEATEPLPAIDGLAEDIECVDNAGGVSIERLDQGPNPVGADGDASDGEVVSVDPELLSVDGSFDAGSVVVDEYVRVGGHVRACLSWLGRRLFGRRSPAAGYRPSLAPTLTAVPDARSGA